VSDFQTRTSLADPEIDVVSDLELIPSIFPDKATKTDPVAAINLVETFPTLGILKEIKVEVLLLDRLTDTSTNVWLRSPTTLRHRMKLSEVHIEKRIPVPETAVDPIYIPNRTSADDLSVPREIPLNVRKILEVPGIFVSDAVVSKGLLNENPLVR
jgi:hypothetical protein